MLSEIPSSTGKETFRLCSLNAADSTVWIRIVKILSINRTLLKSSHVLVGWHLLKRESVFIIILSGVFEAGIFTTQVFSLLNISCEVFNNKDKINYKIQQS